MGNRKISLLIGSYKIFSFCKSPNRGEREPVRPRLNDRSLESNNITTSMNIPDIW
jgi:hypothetical protein